MTKTTLCTALALAAGPAFAAQVDFDTYANTTEESIPLSLDVSDASGGVVFDFAYAGPGTVTNIFLERGLLELLVNGQDARDFEFTNDVEYKPFLQLSDDEADGISNRPYKGATVGWTGTFFSLAAVGTNLTERLQTGLNEAADGLAVTVDAQSGSSADDVLAKIGTDGYRVAAFVRGINGVGNPGVAALISTGEADGGNGSGNGNGGNGGGTVVPTPAALLPGLALLGGLATRRRR